MKKKLTGPQNFHFLWSYVLDLGGNWFISWQSWLLFNNAPVILILAWTLKPLLHRSRTNITMNAVA